MRSSAEAFAATCSAPVKSSAEAFAVTCSAPVKSSAEAFVVTRSAPVRSSAARAALRGQARSYVCFGPIIPVGFARERLGACLDIASYKPGGRARLAQAILARNKRRSGLAREAPRGRRSIFQAPHLPNQTPGTPTTPSKPGTWHTHHTSQTRPPAQPKSPEPLPPRQGRS